ncbi:DinB family protein [Microlunatus speluncae]|uniref:DinB family protein n=1 Tax=Microlunatus speluncae TaxID=2594267 RepID=UPI0012662CC2|nr:DinB family protein [Microlunatus speluncae]
MARPDERQLLEQWLDWQRATVRAKCEGISDEAARRSLIPTSPELTIAGIVAHLAGVERHWLVRSFLGEAIPEPTGGWGGPELPLTELLDAYDIQCARSREIAAAHDLDEPERYAPEGLPIVSLRWILGHLIQETARHLGHLDLLRELTDGQRGY